MDAILGQMLFQSLMQYYKILAVTGEEDEYDLALAIIDGIENRGQQGNYAVERLMFN